MNEPKIAKEVVDYIEEKGYVIENDELKSLLSTEKDLNKREVLSIIKIIDSSDGDYAYLRTYYSVDDLMFLLNKIALITDDPVRTYEVLSNLKIAEEVKELDKNLDFYEVKW